MKIPLNLRKQDESSVMENKLKIGATEKKFGGYAEFYDGNIVV